MISASLKYCESVSQSITFLTNELFVCPQAKLLESSHAWLGASTSSIAGQLISFATFINSRSTHAAVAAYCGVTMCVGQNMQ